MQNGFKRSYGRDYNHNNLQISESSVFYGSNKRGKICKMVPQRNLGSSVLLESFVKGNTNKKPR